MVKSIWGATAGMLGALAGGVAGLLSGGAIYFAAIGGAGAAVLGLLLGTSFGVVLSLMERNRTLDELSAKRVGAWGFLAGAGLIFVTNLTAVAITGPSMPIGSLIPVVLAAAGAYGTLTGLLASGTVAIAKRASPELESRSRTESGSRLPSNGEEEDGAQAPRVAARMALGASPRMLRQQAVRR